MTKVAQFHSRTQPLMPMTPQQRVQEAINGELIPLIAELIYQSDKKSRLAKLSDLRTEGARAVYIAEALMALAPEARHERMVQVNIADANEFAVRDYDQRMVDRQARKDAAFFGDPLLQKFMSTTPRFCALCRDPLLTNAVDVLLTDSGHVKGRAHGLCCAKDEARFRIVDEFTYQLVAVR